MLVLHNEKKKNPKPNNGREGLTAPHENKHYFSIKFLSFKCIRVDCKHKQSHWWAIKFEEVAHKKWNIQYILESVTQHLI